MRQGLLMLAVAFAAFAAVASAAEQGPPPIPLQEGVVLPPGAVAVVNGEPISEKDWVETLKRTAGPSVLDIMIRRVVVKQEAARRGISVSENELQAIFDKKVVEAGGIANLEAYLRPIGESLSDFRDRLHAETLLRRIAEADVVLTDEDLRKVFLEMYGRKAEVQVIVTQSEDAAKAVLEQLKAGADFGQAAIESSIERNTAQNHGYVPMLVSEGMFPKEYEGIVISEAQAEEIFSLEPGGITGAVASAGGTFSIYRLARFHAASGEKFEDVKETVRQTAREYKVQNRAKQILQQLLTQATIKTAL